MALGEKRYRYFLYSQSQYKLRAETELSIGKVYVPGRVLNKGKWKDYTEISQTPSNNKFADSKIIAEGYIEDIQYTRNTSVWRTR